MKKVLVALGLAAAMVGLANCGGGGSVSTVTVVSDTWYDVYGNACGQLRPGCTYVDNYSDVKADWGSDPFYDPYAVPVDATVFDTDLGYNVDAYGYFGANGVFYDYYTGRAVNSGADEDTRDVLAKVGLKEAQVIETAGKDFAAKYQLDEAQGIRVARIMNDWNKIAKTRERTDADVADFTKRLYGVDVNKVKVALENEDNAAMDDLVSQAAANWNTTPENMKRIVTSIYGKRLTQ
jgi:hypothetical protein